MQCATGIEASCLAFNALLAGHAEQGNLEETDALFESMTAGKVRFQGRVPQQLFCCLCCESTRWLCPA